MPRTPHQPADHPRTPDGPPDALVRAVEAIVGERLRAFERLSGGVSSDIWRVETEGRDGARRALCVKRALAKLKVAADWRAPVERNAYEAAWMRRVAAVAPEAAPRLLGQDRARGFLVMEYLPPAAYPVWKAELRDGRVDPMAARRVGALLARIHGASAADPDCAAAFATARIFHAIRIEPYLLATAHAHPPLAAVLTALAETTARTQRALVHGDVSPKNILIGPRGPVFLDAECATWGDPAFDLAFCLTHLLLKCVWRPRWRRGYLACFDALCAAYRAGIDWESPAGLEARAAHLLPGLALARIDGKSPVEYLRAEQDKALVRRISTRLLRAPADSCSSVRRAWAAAVGEEP